jgi:methionyl-tRNA synthetase
LVEKSPHQIPDVVEYLNALDGLNFQGAADNIWRFIGDIDQYIQDVQPFKIIKEDVASGKEHILTLIQMLQTLTYRLIPLMPKTTKIILEAIEQNKKPENLFPRLEA